MEAESRSEIFRRIYSNNTWGSTESRSGTGSSLAETANLRSALPELLEKLKIKSILDIPCGDFNWMEKVDLTGIHYTGADIVPEMIEANNQKYSNDDREFKEIDLLADDLPQADLIICRDCLVHFSFEDAFKAMESMCNSGTKYLLTTTFPLHQNILINTGEWYAINLNAEPFPLPTPLLLLNEGNPDPYFCDKSIGLWRINGV